MYSAKLEILPDNSGNGVTDMRNGAVNGGFPFSVSFTVKILSNQWLLDDNGEIDETLVTSKEERFISNLLLAYQKMNVFSDMKGLLEESWYSTLETDNNENSPSLLQLQRERLNGSENIRVAGAIRYGRYHLFMVYMADPLFNAQGYPSLMTAVAEGEGFLQTNTPSPDSTVHFLLAGNMRDEIFRRISLKTGEPD